MPTERPAHAAAVAMPMVSTTVGRRRRRPIMLRPTPSSTKVTDSETNGAVASVKQGEGHDRDRGREQVGEEHPYGLHDGTLPGRLIRPQVEAGREPEPGFRMVADDSGDRLRLSVTETGRDETTMDVQVLKPRTRFVAGGAITDTIGRGSPRASSSIKRRAVPGRNSVRRSFAVTKSDTGLPARCDRSRRCTSLALMAPASPGCAGSRDCAGSRAGTDVCWRGTPWPPILRAREPSRPG